MIKISLECENIILKILYTEKIILLSTFPKFTKTKILLHHPNSPSVPTTFDSCVSLSSIAAQQNFVKYTEVIISKETKILSLQLWKFKRFIYFGVNVVIHVAASQFVFLSESLIVLATL